MTKLKRIIYLSLAALSTAGALCACSPAGPNNSPSPIIDSELDGEISGEIDSKINSKIGGASASLPSLLSDFQFLNSASLAPLSAAQLAQELIDYDVIFIGEEHGHIGNHIAQAALFSQLHNLRPDITLSMEQFERHEQETLNNYLAGEIGEMVLRHDTDAWDGYAQSYRVLVEYAKNNGLPIIAANVPNDLVRCVAQKGAQFLQTLSQPQASWAASELDLSEGAYKAKYYDFLQASHHHGGSADDTADESKQRARQNANSYAAQMLRDETMALSIAQHLQARPNRKIVHLTGHFHSAALLGTAQRLAVMRPDLKIINIHPVIMQITEDESEQESESLTPISSADKANGAYLIALAPTPRRFVQMKNINAFIARTMDERSEASCIY